MKKQLSLVIVILLASCGAGAVARSAWYNAKPGYPPMPWVKPVAKEPPQVNKTDPATNDPKSDNVGGNDSLTGQPAVVRSDETPKDICACNKRVEGFCVAEIDCVLRHLADRDATIVDAREQHDYDEARLAGAIHVPSSAVYDNMDNLMAVVPVQDSLIIVYCGGGSCEASKNVGIVLRDFGFTNVLLYENGWEEIEASGRFGDFIEMGG
ncbi:MAG TPA: rhodanese-like domain-containing protein [Phycisphaerae bacterium]|nr:rhodanese-like domain-containing protein [Phycisphaerae bacterium]HRW53477.1 rhodanese-like domain-containing protein [Phycisphaerae bacterium]